jgi:hypothetical protein
VAENLWNVAIYIADAQEQALPLVGGGEHDWAYLLAEMDVLRRDDQIAGMVRHIGILIFAVSIVWGYRTALRGVALGNAGAEASASSSRTSASPK